MLIVSKKEFTEAIYLSVYLSLCPSIQLSTYPPIYLSIHPSIHPFTIYLPSHAFHKQH